MRASADACTARSGATSPSFCAAQSQSTSARVMRGACISLATTRPRTQRREIAATDAMRIMPMPSHTTVSFHRKTAAGSTPFVHGFGQGVTTGTGEAGESHRKEGAAARSGLTAQSLLHQYAHPVAGAGIAPELVAPLRAVLRGGEIEAELERRHLLRGRPRQARDAGSRRPRIGLAGGGIEH